MAAGVKFPKSTSAAALPCSTPKNPVSNMAGTLAVSHCGARCVHAQQGHDGFAGSAVRHQLPRIGGRVHREGRRPHFPVPSRSSAIFSSAGWPVSWAMSITRRFVPAAEWEDQRQILGLKGERIAIAYLTSCGWSVEAHRFKLGRHDVDLVVRRANTVAFVEVKTRSSTRCGSGLEAVNRRKQRDIARVASIWVLRYGRPDDQYRFDLISVQDAGGAAPIVEHVPNAWSSVGPWG
jgi:putative endonuclease